MGYNPWGSQELDPTERLTLLLSLYDQLSLLMESSVTLAVGPIKESTVFIKNIFFFIMKFSIT